MEPAATIVVVDDAPEVRLLVRTRLRLSGRFEVVAEGADGEDAVALAGRHRPALMLLDVSMPGMDGLEALPRVLAASPTTRVVLYSGFEEQVLVARAHELGAAGFIEKSVPVDSLVERLETTLLSAASAAPQVTAASAASADQQVLDEHLERFREVFDEAAIGMATMTLTGHLVRCNRALGALLRRPAAELVGEFYGSLTDGQRDRVADALADIQQRPLDVVRVEHQVADPRGPRQVTATLAPVRDSGGRPLYVFLQVQDMTEERAALDALRRSEQRFRLMVETVRDYAIFMLSPEGVVASWNNGAQRTNGYTAEEIIGQHFRVFYPPEVQQARHPEHELEIALREGRYEEEGWRIRKDGSRFWANVVITAVHDDDGRHVGFAKVTRDNTARREAQERLRQSEERFRLMVETVRDYAIFMLSPEGVVASWNNGAQRIKGYTAEEIIGQHFRVFYPPEPQQARHPEHELEIALREGRYEEEGWRIRKDGSRFWANVVITALHDDDGRHVGFAKVTRDNTARRELEQERERAVQALADANAELESLNARLAQAADDQAQFLAVTAHELRTPVGVLAGSSETLARHWEDLTDEEREDLLTAMGTGTARLRRLLTDLLTASRLQADKLEMRAAPVRVGDVVADAVRAVRQTRADADILVEVPEQLAVVGDRDRLAQVLDNLLANALRHGVPPVRVAAGADDGTVRIRVSDAGAGVPADMRPRLFDRFATGRREGGTGLGLFIAREIARAHRGDAVYEPPSPGEPAGAFVLTLPRETVS